MFRRISVLTALLPVLLVAAPLVARQAPPVPAPQRAPEQPTPEQPTPEQLSLKQRMLVRCSAAFALVAHGQQAGNPEALAWPDLSTSGKDFFVRASAEVMDARGLTREQISALLSAEARDLMKTGTLAQVMPPCLGLLPTE